TVADKQARLMPLFKHLTALTREKLPLDQRDERLKGVGILPRGTLFSCFHARHLAEATELYVALYGAKDFNDFIHLCEQARQIVNEGMFVYAVSVAVLHREDCKGITVPPIQEVFPDRFVPAETINRANKEASNHPDQQSIVVEAEETGNILDPEYKLSYFREDIGINAHHWHWHIVYPATWNPTVMGKEKDRKGELFFYMHQQMCARYDSERLSNGLQRMIPFHNFDEPLEGYAPHLTSLVSGLQYASRPEGYSIHDLSDVDVQDMVRWRERILDAINMHYIVDKDNNKIPLDIEHGTDILGDIIESSDESKNVEYYGSLHNWGHVMMANITDPDHRFQENPGVMSDTSTSLRDPIFYRWHRFIDNIFQEHKKSFHPYTKEELSFPGVEVVGVSINSKTANVITTLIKESLLELSHGINFGTDQSVKVKYHHLDHEPFTYNIVVENNSGAEKHSTVRIFLAPKYDELNNKLEPDEQRRLFIELDKFFYTLTPGKNTIVRNHQDSSVTISKVRTFDQLGAGEGVSEDSTEYCSCGWPEHMLIPRGSHKGMEFELFVMLTDHDEDTVAGLSENAVCSDAVSYCGARDDRYPDKKAMGFPFDRKIEARTAAEFLTPNMGLTDIKIKFHG
uniref:Hemocyanin AA6 chain n=1 Tax=Androctonus australis TaxID=6858 RepID=HCY6_ANDAU|nr:RecName: Full=Hemocyanin AA6 chain [Androctonus australis]3IXV_A Chain A, Hemocyanin AA6 chain [Androctonus australis]3IXV_C Chain C, Hemocyanin AA6 chain [Androctonus australis]3IXV_D Chain D, Hemocyanin AA6 chain [Androctonus australis]3IXV_E Chain E, Hemocyanin AA6 chain [Androctonus australis]3IXV_F Chain F, Hemocyanin AA6 chain [Androctonus australis]3IXV_G Chain G, Hemocyanin AA6 chain [Androctonus australis]3IXV_H Chain H, Hemocyanin AA6 chain [Androctonus australis]3IXV_I Chain I